LLDAARATDAHARRLLEASASSSAASPFPRVLYVITGKGPRKEYYLARIRELKLTHTRFITPWLKAEDYPLVLASADIGVCLHTSSSGLDLPMKVVDMFGCGLPVCAVDFKALPELVTDGTNGRVFRTAEQLAGQLIDLLATRHTADGPLATLRRGVAQWIAGGRWTQNWTRNALPLFRDTP
jgi:beta-1,4-mannosyltransferase